MTERNALAGLRQRESPGAHFTYRTPLHPRTSDSFADSNYSPPCLTDTPHILIVLRSRAEAYKLNQSVDGLQHLTLVTLPEYLDTFGFSFIKEAALDPL
jgi:hypothetical protein